MEHGVTYAKRFKEKEYMSPLDGGDEDMKRTDMLICIRAGNKCSYPTCKLDIYVVNKKTKNTLEGDITNIGEVAHIETYKKDKRSPRFNKKMKNKELYEACDNKILLCVDHHRFIDKRPNDYPPESLKRMREEHENWLIKHPETLRTNDKDFKHNLQGYIQKMKWLSNKLETAQKDNDVEEYKRLLTTATGIYVTNFQWKGEIIKLFRD